MGDKENETYEQEKRRIFFWATDDCAETWSGPCATIEDAVKEAFEDEDNDVCYVAPGTWSDPANLIDSEWLFEQLSENCVEDSPLEEDWEMYWGVNKEDMAQLTDELQAAFRRWAEPRKLRRWYVVHPSTMTKHTREPAPPPTKAAETEK